MNIALAESMTVSSPTFENVSKLLHQAVDDGVFPGAVLAVAQSGHVVFRESVGVKSEEGRDGAPPLAMTSDTVFDIASLTEVLVTTALIMRLIESDKLKITDKVSRYIQGFGVLGKSVVTIEQLLNHTSGLVPWSPFFEELLRANAGSRMGILTSRAAKDFIINSINRSSLKYEPGAKQIYSDLGFILLGHLCEILTGLPLDKAGQKFLFQPMGLKSTSFIDLSMIKRRGIHPVTDLIAPTEECSWRKRVLCGEVHDDNAWAMGGIAGHSGVFSTALDLTAFCTEMIKAYHGESSLISSSTMRRFVSVPENRFDGTGWRLGWDSASSENGLADSGLSAQSFGLCGFTGCSVWIEPQREISIVLMSNRIHPSRSNRKIRAFRPEIHDAVLNALIRPSSAAA